MRYALAVRRLRGAVVKEWRQEARSFSGLAVTGLFALVGGVLGGVAIYGIRPDPQLLAGLLWLILLFAGAVTLPRTFLSEDEAGTADLLRLVAPPGVAFAGKAVLACGQMLVVATLAGGALLVQAGVGIASWPLLVISLGLGAVSVGATAALCGAVASGAANRGVVAAALAVPLMLFLGSLGTTALLPAFGDSRVRVGWQAVLGLAGYAAGTLTMGPPILAAVWRR